MLHERRTFHVADAASIEDLAEKVTECTWTLCTGFRLRVEGQELLFLNDSTSENGAQEYAVFTPDGTQIESITFGWCDAAAAEQHIRDVLAGAIVQMGHYHLSIDLSPEHVCHLCR